MRTINKWFKELDSFALSFLFPGLYSEIMESADPERCNINSFIKKATEEWKKLSNEDKIKLYEEFKEINI